MKLSDILNSSDDDTGLAKFVSWYELRGKDEIYFDFDSGKASINTDTVLELGINDDQNLFMINRYLQDDGIKIVKKDHSYSFVLLDNI